MQLGRRSRRVRPSRYAIRGNMSVLTSATANSAWMAMRYVAKKKNFHLVMSGGAAWSGLRWSTIAGPPRRFQSRSRDAACRYRVARRSLSESDAL